MKGIWLVRHGALPPDPERRFVGARNVAMSAAGEAQIRELAGQWMPELAPHLSAIICSDLGRCQRTAAILRGTLPVPVHTEPGFREISLGAWEGHSRREIEQLWPGAFAARGRDFAAFVPPTGASKGGGRGESFCMVQNRAKQALVRWRARYPQGLLLVVSHAGVMRTLLAEMRGLPLQRVMEIVVEYGGRHFLPAW